MFLSFRHADILTRMRETNRERFSMVIALSSNEMHEDRMSIWVYDSKGLHHSSLDSRLGHLLGDVVKEYRRSWMVTFPARPFIETDKEFGEGYTDATRKKNLFSTTIQDIYAALKLKAGYYVGESEHHFNEKGACFAIIQLFKPKFEVGQYATFKDKDGHTEHGLIIGLQGQTGTYTIKSENVDHEVQEKAMMLSSVLPGRNT